MRRQAIATSPEAVQKAMEAGIQGFLGSQNVDLGSDGAKVLLPKGGMEAIQFLASDGWMNDTEANNALFNALDQNQDPSGNNTIHMADQYTNFVQEVTKLIGQEGGTDVTQDPEIAEASDAFSKSCGGLSQILQTALTSYIDNGGAEDTKKTDDDFVLWAQENDVDYMNGIKNCDINKQAYQKVVSEKLGNNYALFMAAFANIKPIIDPGPKPVDGITMAIRKGSGMTTDTGAGMGVPWYRLPMLDTLIGQWIEGNGLAPWEFSSENTTEHTDSETTESSANFGFDWRIFGASASTSSSNTETNALKESQKFTIKWGSMALVKIERGAWFDDWRVAGVLRDAKDDISKQAEPAFKEFFGTKEKPGPASIYNYQVIVGYQPSVEIEYASEEEATKASKVAAEAGINFLIFTAGGSGSKESASSDFKAVGNKLTFQDSSQAARFIGFTQKSIWDSESSVEAGDLSDMPT